MTHQAFAGASLVLRDGSPLEELRLGKGRELALSKSTGEINAHDTKDAMRIVGEMMQAMASGQIVHQPKTMSQREEALATSELRRQALPDRFRAPPRGAPWGPRWPSK